MSEVCIGARPKFTQCRSHDYVYDPVFTVSAPKDYIKHVMMARQLTSKYAVCPVFQSMFSDLPNYPRQTVVRRATKDTLKCEDDIRNIIQGKVDCWCRNSPKSPAVTGNSRFKFFVSPLSEQTDLKRVELTAKISEENVDCKKQRNKLIQTMYRESSAQTLPWKTPYYKIPEGTDPELLKINFLKDHMLPAGVHEIELIKRARIKRGWDKIIKNLTEDCLDEKKNILYAMETDEWLYREQEIKDIQNLRMELLENILQEMLDNSSIRAKMILDNRTKYLKEQKEKKIATIKQHATRELRRLHREHNGISMKYQKLCIIKEHTDKVSELYGPLQRHGEQAKRRHENIDTSYYSPKLEEIENSMSTFPSWVKRIDLNNINPQLKGRHLCQRETKWSEPILKQLYEELKCTKRVVRKEQILWELKEKAEVFEKISGVQGTSKQDDADFKSALFIQSILRGRTTQSLVFEGRDKCRELIKELKSTYYLQDEKSRRVKREKFLIYQQQRTRELEKEQVANLTEMLNKLEGTVVGTMLDFLNKELRRILDERKVHALAMLMERERNMQEAAEAGRRQLEEKIRREQDEIFKQMTKIHQDTVDVYLQKIILDGVEMVSEEQAQKYIQHLADKLDEVSHEDQSFSEKEETIANMVHKFLIPEINKIQIRKQIAAKQKSHLKAIHEAVYDVMDFISHEQDGVDE